MGVTVRIFAVLLLVSGISAVPSDSRRASLADDVTRDLSAEPSDIATDVVPAPHHRQNPEEPETAAATGLADHSEELIGGSQTFFPSFSSLFEPRQRDNFRLGFGNQEGAYSQRPNSYRSLLNYPLFGNYKNVDNFGKPSTQASAPLVDASSSVLGSGNFGIIRGGTFFSQNDDDDYTDGYSSFYNNGHGRPSLGVGYIANPRPNYNQEQFANFRDFADINAPANTAFSHFVVVYANKNGTIDEVSEESKNIEAKPKNIIETLELLDSINKTPKLSKAKAKLEATKQKLRIKQSWKKPAKSEKQDEEPLLALS